MPKLPAALEQEIGYKTTHVGEREPVGSERADPGVAPVGAGVRQDRRSYMQAMAGVAGDYRMPACACRPSADLPCCADNLHALSLTSFFRRFFVGQSLIQRDGLLAKLTEAWVA